MTDPDVSMAPQVAPTLLENRQGRSAGCQDDDDEKPDHPEVLGDERLVLIERNDAQGLQELELGLGEHKKKKHPKPRKEKIFIPIEVIDDLPRQGRGAQRALEIRGMAGAAKAAAAAAQSSSSVAGPRPTTMAKAIAKNSSNNNSNGSNSNYFSKGTGKSNLGGPMGKSAGKGWPPAISKAKSAAAPTAKPATAGNAAAKAKAAKAAGKGQSAKAISKVSADRRSPSPESPKTPLPGEEPFPPPFEGREENLPPGWKPAFDKYHQDWYYWNTMTDETSWEIPQAAGPEEEQQEEQQDHEEEQEQEQEQEEEQQEEEELAHDEEDQQQHSGASSNEPWRKEQELHDAVVKTELPKHKQTQSRPAEEEDEEEEEEEEEGQQEEQQHPGKQQQPLQPQQPRQLTLQPKHMSPLPQQHLQQDFGGPTTMLARSRSVAISDPRLPPPDELLPLPAPRPKGVYLCYRHTIEARRQNPDFLRILRGDRVELLETNSDPTGPVLVELVAEPGCRGWCQQQLLAVPSEPVLDGIKRGDIFESFDEFDGPEDEGGYLFLRPGMRFEADFDFGPPCVWAYLRRFGQDDIDENKGWLPTCMLKRLDP